MKGSRPRAAGALDGLLAAALFALSAPLSKLLLASVDPVALAGLLYLGAGGALAALLGLSAARGRQDRESRLERRDVPWLVGAILVGGVAAPIALLLGLSGTPAATASLLLTLETAATAAWAALLFGESVGRTTWAAVALVTAGSVLLAIDVRGSWGLAPGALLVMAACALWGLDNNLTRHVSLRDPKAIVAAKGLGAGSVSLVLVAALGRPMPSPLHAGLALAVGAVSYGASIVLFVRSLRALGAARTGALFGTAPFLAAGISFLIFREAPQAPFYGSVVLMACATWLLARERHEHVHVHERETHAHRHAHDEHHIHPHSPDQEAQGEHAHAHQHARLAHAHPHRPDAHHRHIHGEES